MTFSDEQYNKGNAAFVGENYALAINLYTKAIEIDPSRQNYYRNRANSYLKLEKYQEAKFDANKALNLGMMEPKLFLWKGISCYYLNEYEEAEKAFSEGKTFDNETKDTFDVWLDRCTVKIQEIKDREAEILLSKLIKVRHEWYQTEMNVIVNILVKNAKPDEVCVEISDKTLLCKVQGSDKRLEFELDVNLAHAINSQRSTWKIVPSKIEIQMKKLAAGQWKTLDEIRENIKTRCVVKKNWDKVVSEEIGEQDDNGDEMFERIFAQGSDEMKRAMNKSFVESGGTVLSTNWKDVRKKRVETLTPDGMEWKQWDGKLTETKALKGKF
uniref:CS domain-containing protein n=1 Tax=Strigamia maritima TaxID=126957 RepID=T1IM34_STRMM